MVTRLSGLNSGLDVESLVTGLMKAEKMPLDSLNQKKTTLTWQTDLYREINTKLSALRNSLDNMRLSGDWKMNSATSSNEAAVTVKADGTSSKINHSIIVNDLASGASVQSSDKVTSDTMTGTALTTPLKITAGSNDQLNVTLGGVTRTLTLTAGDYADAGAVATELQNQIDNMFGKYNGGTRKIEVNAVAGSLQFKTNADPDLTSSTAPTVTVSSVNGHDAIKDLGFKSGQSNRINTTSAISTLGGLGFSSSGSFLVNGQKISYTGADSIKTIMDKVNNSNAGVNMTYDSAADKFTFTTKDTGSAAIVNLQESVPPDGNFLSTAKLSTGTVSGKDASVTIDGVQSYRSSNTFTSDGVTYTIKQKTTTPVTANVNQDVDAMVNKIKDFVKIYNESIDLMNTRVKEVKNRSYKPLTDDQKKAMSDTDIAAWEKTAKVGLLHNDGIVKSTISGLRSFLTSSVGSVSNASYNALYKIGITTMPYSNSMPQDAGKIQLDEDALKKAISEDPSAVTGIFSNQPDGIAQKMYDEVNGRIKELSTKAGGSTTAIDNVTTDLGDKIHDLNQKIATMTLKLADKEDYYYKMFAAMDSAVGKNNSTLTWLSQFSG
ncbi:flagellar filament capping protein FliD [Cohnella sp. GbtcB17]|uniref:flagellar filament capping protein FliD n=1 Tax=Cohnella sp. GbtcB17 TaxID=2824762 RepID=UPI001C305D0B|nr:flagellar filament capping protein FliD [Cohnella sp. GbtcB17]